MIETNLNAVWLPSASAAFRRIKDEVVIVDTSSNRMMTLNETGSELWSMLDGRTVQEMIDAMEEIFEVDPGEAKLDVISFLENLETRGLIELERA